MSFVKKARFKNRGFPVFGIAGIIAAIMAVFALVSCKPSVDPVPAPVITINTQPRISTTLTQGNISGSLSVKASVTLGASLSYQWYHGTGASTSDVTVISGATGASFTFPISLPEGTYYYFCEVRAQGASSVRSSLATVIVSRATTPAITITTHPAPNTSVTQGVITGSLRVYARVTQNGTLRYQWYRSTSANTSGGTALINETGASFTIPASLTAGTYYYFCEVRAQGASSVRSNLATVIVNSATTPVITIYTQPAPNTGVTQGSITGVLRVYAAVTEGKTLSYQWYRNTSANTSGGTAISGETSANFTIPASLAAGTYYYFCEVMAQGAVSVRSNLATVNVTIQPYITIDIQPVVETTVIQGSITGTLSVRASVTQNVGLLYQWYRNTNASNTGGMAIIGATGASFTIPTALTAGTYYYFCEIAAFGAGAVRVRSNVARIQVYSPPIPVITKHPTRNTYVTQGNISGSLNVEASANYGAELYYQWYQNTNLSTTGGTLISGETNANFAIPADLSAGTHYFFCEITATGGRNVRSNAALIYVSPIEAEEAEFIVELGFADEPALIEQTATASANTGKIFTVNGTGYTAYQWRVDGATVGTSSSYTFNYPAETYELFVLVTDSAGRKYSGSCRVTVLP